jgi:hypothetical protein
MYSLRKLWNSLVATAIALASSTTNNRSVESQLKVNCAANPWNFVKKDLRL